MAAGCRPRKGTRIERPAADDDEARDVVVEVLDAVGKRHEAEHFAGPRRCDCGGVCELIRSDELGAARRIVRGDDLYAGQRPQEPLALRESLRVRVDAAQAGQRRAGHRKQLVHNRQFDFADNRELMLEQQVVVAMDAAADRIFDRKDAVAGGPRVDGAEDFFEAAAGHEVGARVHAPRRRLAERPKLPLIRDSHHTSFAC